MEWWEDLYIANENVSVGETVREVGLKLTSKLREE
jgi:phage-related holin